ncbi:hypothetical protein IQ251_02730 [Saccharopolyspora sp. HNM0983]|uniref:DUF3558 domain-containing protein n=1 Tax=Saccharopolyspora montiporae TaxID=2781240 RepID=A0A929B560_9PSEU|nr:hypothetical protein [Saccharopolyspora sp. HNM0983]MBE9373354.1 hypothetical protein [Saccharopolyspora sp. HNM0983]
MIAILFPKWPSLFPSAPSYTAAPDPCTAVPQETIAGMFGPNQPAQPNTDDTSIGNEQQLSCAWNPTTEQADALGRYSYLTVEVTAHSGTNGRADFESVDNDFRYFDKSNPTAIPGIGDRAAAVHEEHEVRVLASRANLTVDVRYDSVNMRPESPRETPIPRERLDAEAHRVTRHVLNAAGAPS